VASLWLLDLFKEIITINWIPSSPKWTEENPIPFFNGLLFKRKMLGVLPIVFSWRSPKLT
jgi:hypothetical protein